MDNNVSYLVHEGVVARLERTNKRIVFALIMSIFCLQFNHRRACYERVHKALG